MLAAAATAASHMACLSFYIHKSPFRRNSGEFLFVFYTAAPFLSLQFREGILLFFVRFAMLSQPHETDEVGVDFSFRARIERFSLQFFPFFYGWAFACDGPGKTTNRRNPPRDDSPSLQASSFFQFFHFFF